MPEVIHVLMITNSPNNNHLLSAHSTKAKALAALDRYVIANWQQMMGNIPMPDTDEEREVLYFNDNEAESYDLTRLTIDKEN